MNVSPMRKLAFVCTAFVAASACGAENPATHLREPFSLHPGEKRKVTPPGIEVTLRSLSEDSGCLAANDCSAMLFRGTLVLRMGAHTELHAVDAMVAPDAPCHLEFANFDLELGAIRPDAGGRLAATFSLLEPIDDEAEVPLRDRVLLNADGAGANTVDSGTVPTTSALVAPAPANHRSARTCEGTHIALPAADRTATVEPVPIWIEPEQASLSNQGWTLSLHAAVPLSKLEVRQQGQPDWTTMHREIGEGREYYAGFGMFDEHVVIEVRADTPDGRKLGPYQLPFDALSSIREQDLRTLLDLPDVWVQFDDPNVYFSMFYERNCAIREVRYSIDGKELDKRLALPPCSMRRHGEIPSDNSEILRLGKTPTFVAFQVTFYDGTVSPVKVAYKGMH
jgi:hypothetical protein